MKPPRDSAHAAGWLMEAGARLRILWPAKAIGTTLAMTVFFIAYFAVLNHPVFPVTTMPLTPVDRWIAFQPWTLPLYLSLWFYVSLAPALIASRRELICYGLAAVLLGATGLAIFLLWPTAVPAADVEWSLYPSFAFLHSVDASGNACPSLHVAFAVFSALWFVRMLRGMGAGRVALAINWLWCLGILYSTIATRQHVSLDVLAGAVLGAIAAVLLRRWLAKAPA